VNFTIRSMEHAHDLEAQVVILHLGHVEMPNPIERFKEVYKGGKTDQDEGVSLREEQKDLRENKCRKHLDAVLFSLEKLNREAERLGILIGIENRYHFHEIPDLKEIGMIFSEFEGGSVHYWHDVGHAAVQETLGLCRQKDLLEAYSAKLVGIHLHDAKGLEDHLAPGQGKMNYEEIRPFMKPDLIKILEVHPKVERKALVEGIQFIKNEINDNTND
jgi:sugar phosphate isomerase/epimerase